MKNFVLTRLMLIKKIRTENKDLAFTVNAFINLGACNFTREKNIRPCQDSKLESPLGHGLALSLRAVVQNQNENFFLTRLLLRKKLRTENNDLSFTMNDFNNLTLEGINSCLKYKHENQVPLGMREIEF